MYTYSRREKILFVLLVLFFICFAYLAVNSFLVIVSDGACEFFNDILNTFNEPNYLSGVFQDSSGVARYISRKLSGVFFFFLSPFLPTLQLNVKAYSFSLLVVPVLLLLLVFYVGNRMKRQDISVFALLYYCFFELPYMTWIPRESHTAIMFQFIFFIYFLSKEKLKNLDYLILIFSFIACCESFENIILLGCLFFLFGIFYKIKKGRLASRQFYLGILAIIMSIYSIYKSQKVLSSGEELLTISSIVQRWLNALFNLWDSSINSLMILSFVSIILLVFLSIKKIDLFENKKWLFISVFLFLIVFIYVFINVQPFPIRDSNLWLFFMFLPLLLMGFILLFDINEVQLSKIDFHNIIFVSCVVGILQFVWNINIATLCFQYIDSLQTKLKIENNHFFVNCHIDESSKVYGYDSPTCSIFRSIIVSNEYEINRILLPDKEHRDYNLGFERETYYDASKNKLKILGFEVPIKTNLWDLTKVSEEFKNKNMTLK